MRRILNEVARMKKIAGIISEGHYEEGRDDRAKKLEKIALKVHAKIENSVDVEDDMLQMSKREIAEFVPKGAPVKAIVDLVHSYMRGNMPLPDDFEDDRPEFDYEDDPDRMVYERGADLADASEIKGVEEARNQVPTVPGKLEIDAQDLGDDPRSYQDSARAVKTYLTRAGIKAKVTGDSNFGMIYIQLADPKQAAKATKVIQDELGYEAVPSLDDSPARIDYDPDYAGPRWGEQPFWKNK